MRVRIGITTSFEEQEQRLNHAYIHAVEKAGGAPLILPMLESVDVMMEIVSLLDGLVVSGGPAVMDGLIGSLPEDISEPASIRIHSDKHYLAEARSLGIPILGICYGMQLINAMAGGTIYADVEDALDDTFPHTPNRGCERHDIIVEEDSILRSLLPAPRVNVNSRHIQALATVAPTFRVVARSTDGVIEAFENEDGTVLGVQFHPERMDDEMMPVFQHIVACAQRRKLYVKGRQ